MSEAVNHALRELQKATRARERALENLHDAIRAALDAGERQVDLVKQTGYTRERLRQIAAKRSR